MFSLGFCQSYLLVPWLALKTTAFENNFASIISCCSNYLELFQQLLCVQFWNLTSWSCSQISGTVRANLFMTKIKYTQNKRGEVHASYKPYFHGNPRAIFRSLLFSEYQEGLELANHLTLILLGTWAVQAALHISSCATKTST